MKTLARLDDLRPSRRRSALFSDQVGAVVATSIEDVVPALARVEEATASGHWAVGYIGYEAAPAFDSRLVVQARRPGSIHGELPLVWFGLFAKRVLNPGPDPDLGDYELSDWGWVDDREAYERAVETVREHIAAGDVYQVNFTTRLRAAFAGDPVAFYHDLAAAQSGGYGTYLDTGRYRIVSASPELFFDRHPGRGGRDRLVTRPMKGTAPRGRWPAEDLTHLLALEASEKERAENLIIVDLIRNDLGRIADFGTVAVEDLMAIERYDTVWQMTTTVAGSLDPSAPLVEVLAGLFPSGSVTGAPKVRVMQLIRELETEPRGVYTGAIGFVAPHGATGPSASFSVGIRTVVIDAESGEAEYGIGGGVTFDSDPRAEYEEAAIKSRILTHGRSDFELIESMRWEPDVGWFWLDPHLDRLESSAGYFGVPIQRDLLVERLEAEVGGGRALRVRVAVDRSGLVDIFVEPLPDEVEEPVVVVVDTEAVDSSNPFLYHKTTRREVYETRLRRHRGADDVLMVNERGELTEATIANLAVKLDGKWCTPPVDAGCLPGIYRHVLLEQGDLVERTIRPSDLEACEGIALVNSVRLWREGLLADDR